MRHLVAGLSLLLALAAIARAQAGTVKSIELPHFAEDLPAGPERELFASRCLSCHSTRYIAMQPLVPAAKWEENVKKMAKTYAAPIGEDEVPRIVQYLVEFQRQGTEPLARTAQRDVAIAALPPSEDLQRGKAVYAAACASCHGPAGKGDGQNMVTLLPKATDLTDGRFARNAVTAALVRGVRGTAMPAFPSLSNEDVAAVTAYTVSLGAAVEKVQPPAEAKALFDTACASCHGTGAAANVGGAGGSGDRRWRRGHLDAGLESQAQCESAEDAQRLRPRDVPRMIS
jgi:mono/diheme cytochrome c family protein